MRLRSPVRSAPAWLLPSVAVAGLFLAACTSVSPSPSSSPTIAPVTASPVVPPPTDSATASPPVSAAASAGPTTLEVDWTVDFSVTAPADWSTDEVHETLGGVTTGDTLWIGAGQRFVAVTRSGPETAQEWLDQLAATAQLDATEPAAVDLGGIPAYRVDLVVSDQASDARCLNNGRCYTLFQDQSGYWPVVEGRPTALWIVETGGETLAIATDSREVSFSDWAATVENVLATLEWQ